MKNLFVKTAVAGVLLASTLFSVTANAQAMDAAASGMKSDALYMQLGQKAGLVELMDVFLPKLIADPRLAGRFNAARADYLKGQLVDQICMVSGGPCKYSGADMKTAHMGMEIKKAEFNALVEDLQASMDAKNIPFTTQNALLARLASMHRDVITSH